MNPERRNWQSATTDGRRLRRHRLLRLAHGCARYHDTTDDPGGDQPRGGNPDRQELCSHDDPTTTHFLCIVTFSPLDHEWSDLAPGLDEQLSCILLSRRISSHDTHHFAPACGGHWTYFFFSCLEQQPHILLFWFRWWGIFAGLCHCHFDKRMRATTRKVGIPLLGQFLKNIMALGVMWRI